MHKKTVAALIAGATTALVVGAAGATGAPANPDSLKCFTGGDGTCTLSADGTQAHVTATTNPDSGGGVYFPGKSSKTQGRLLSAVDFAFSYQGTAATGGSPRIAVPVDTDNNGSTDLYAVLDWNLCAGNVETAGSVSTNDGTCTVEGTDMNWDAYSAVHPSWTVAKKSLPFVVADYATDTTLSNVSFGVAS